MLNKLIGRNREEEEENEKVHKEKVEISSLPNTYYGRDLKRRMMK
jgi:hypothetical protein